ncbi:MAG TPA: metal-dependent hydrolase [Planctomycetota bacterium]|nr:metal-dependent hydrolase [Planctomycetota bacterium]
MLGSVLPDLDAFSRVLGKKTFLRIHQTYTHAIPVILCLAALCALGLKAGGIDAPWAAEALALGMFFHRFLDVTNTYGIRLLAPFSARRTCTERVFFIDAVVVAATIPTFGWVAWSLARTGDAGWKVQSAYGAAMAVYRAAKMLLRRRAARRGPAESLALLPNALIPWESYGCATAGRQVRLDRLKALSGVLLEDRVVDIPDEHALRGIEPRPRPCGKCPSCGVPCPGRRASGCPRSTSSSSPSRRRPPFSFGAASARPWG